MDEGDDAVPRAMSELSFDGKFPVGQLGVGLTRMRSAINEYTDKLSEVHWYEQFKTGTVKALERRLNQHVHTVGSCMHIDVMEAYKSMRERVSALLGFYKSIAQWCSNGNDGLLIPVTSLRSVFQL